MAEALYDIPLDSSTLQVAPPFVPKTIIFVNGSNVNVTVTDEMGHAVTFGANDGGAIPCWPSRHWNFTSAAGYTSGSAYVYFSDKRIPGAVGGLVGAVSGVVANQRVNAQVGDFVDGAIVTLGTQADAAYAGGATATVISALKSLYTRLRGGQAMMANSLPVVIASDQLPAAGALADATANPTTTSVGADLSGWNGTTWDKLRTLAASGYGLGTALRSGAYGTYYASAAPRSTSSFTLLNTGGNGVIGATDLLFAVSSSLNQSCTYLVYAYTTGKGMVLNSGGDYLRLLLSFTLTAGPVSYHVTSDGVFDSAGSSVALLGGSAPLLRHCYEQIVVLAQPTVAPTAGTLETLVQLRT